MYKNVGIFGLIMVAIIFPAYFNVSSDDTTHLKAGILIGSVYFLLFALGMFYVHHRVNRGAAQPERQLFNPLLFAICLASAAIPWIANYVIFQDTPLFGIVLYVSTLFAVVALWCEYAFIRFLIKHQPPDISWGRTRIVLGTAFLSVVVVALSGGAIFFKSSYTGTLMQLDCHAYNPKSAYVGQYILRNDNFNPFNPESPAVYLLGNDTDDLYAKHLGNTVKIEGLNLSSGTPENVCGIQSNRLLVITINAQ